MSLIAVICKEGMFKKEVFECANPAINDYLRDYQITDPEAYACFGLEKAQRGTLFEQ
jgi:hypothetical protein